MKKELEERGKEALKGIAGAQTPEELYEVHVKYLGRKGIVTLMMQGISKLPQNDRAEAGKLFNKSKKSLEEAYAEREEMLKAESVKRALNERWVDVTLSGRQYEVGHIHPISQVQQEVEKIFSEMGFSVMDGPEVESEYYNFDGLNILQNHPARDMQDTFFIDQEPTKKDGHLVLRTQTSPVQLRTMEKYGAPARVIVPGRVFRNEATDASHEHTFDQVEGLLIDKDISLAHLKGVMQEFLTRLFKRETKVRFRPGYFPFVEPGVELDMSCMICNEQGCRVCKQTGWLEFMGAGMVHPNVLKAGGVDSQKYQGWAFGFGLTRLVMMRYGIDDIRLLSSGDVRFLKQF